MNFWLIYLFDNNPYSRIILSETPPKTLEPKQLEDNVVKPTSPRGQKEDGNTGSNTGGESREETHLFLSILNKIFFGLPWGTQNKHYDPKENWQFYNFLASIV